MNVDHFVLSGQHLSFKAFLTHPALSILLLFFFFFYFSIHHSNPFPRLRGAGLYRKLSGELVTMVTALTVVTTTNIPDLFDDCWLSRHTCGSGNIANFNITTNHSWVKFYSFIRLFKIRNIWIVWVFSGISLSSKMYRVGWKSCYRLSKRNENKTN